MDWLGKYFSQFLGLLFFALKEKNGPPEPDTRLSEAKHKTFMCFYPVDELTHLVPCSAGIKPLLSRALLGGTSYS